MPHKLCWTHVTDARLKRLRVEGASWDDIAAELGISRNAAIERGRRIGARRPPPSATAPPEDPDRLPLPPGHDASWGALVAGTLLNGRRYPTWGDLRLRTAKPRPADAPT
jgi:hypothetical protein